MLPDDNFTGALCVWVKHMDLKQHVRTPLHLGVTDLISLEYLKTMSVHFQLCYPHQRSLVEVGAEYQVPYWNNASVTYG